MAIALIVIAVLFYVLFMTREDKGHIKTVYKCVPTLCACALAVYTALKGNAAVNSYLIICGLAFCVLADAALEKAIIPGAALFGAAHLCFTAAFIVSRSHGYVFIVCFAVLFTFLCYMFTKLRKHKPEQAPFIGFILYAFLLSVMASLGIDLGGMFAAGGALFALSDTILFLRMFGALHGKVYGWVLMGVYYAALFLIAAGA